LLLESPKALTEEEPRCLPTTFEHGARRSCWTISTMRWSRTGTRSSRQRHEMIALRHCDDAVVVEFHLLGTHRGPLGPVPPTGGSFKVRMTAFFVFDENEALVCERVYFDQLSFLRQLLGGINLRSPTGLLTLARVLRGFAALSREPKDIIPDTPARTIRGST
jgi:hypothetical protein